MDLSDRNSLIIMNRFFTLLLAASCLTAVGQEQSIFLDGENDYINVFIPVESNDFSFSVEVKMTELPSSGVYIVDTRLDDQRGYYMWIRPDGLTDFGWENGQDNFNFVQVSLADVDWFNSWQEITIVQTGSALSLFVEGELKAELDGYLDAIASRDRIILGRRNNGPGHDFHGLMDNVFVGSGMLSAADIQLAKCNGNGDGLGAGFWNLDNGATNSVGTNTEAYIQLENGAAFVDFDSNQTGCVDSDACNFDPDASCDDGSCAYPLAIELGDDIETCEEFVTLNAGAGFDNYLWSTGETTQAIQVYESGLFSVDAFVNAAPPAGYGSLSFDGLDDWVEVETNSGLDVGDANFTIGLEAKFETSNTEVALFDYYMDDNSARINLRRMPSGEIILYVNDNLDHELSRFSSSPVPIQSWLQIVATFDRETSDIDLYINGELQNGAYQKSDDITAPIDPSGILQFGKYGDGQQDGYFHGKMSSAAFWHRRLSHQEIENFEYCSTVDLDDETFVGFWGFGNGAAAEISDLANGNNQAFINGAIDASDNPGGCNNCSESDSISVEILSSGCIDDYACNYDSMAECDDGSCDYSCCPGPGCCSQGLFWDWELGQCFPTNPADINLDGCVQLNDLLDLLSAYGDCDAEESAWQCGDPLQYQGYDYETVQIGEQCWFAENLRAENYRNGEAIPAGLSNSEWAETAEGAVSVYDGDMANLSTYGRLYNWYAVDDYRALCPLSWKIATNQEWSVVVESVASDQDLIGQDWVDVGTNTSGFSLLPGGKRDYVGVFAYESQYGYYWTSTEAYNNSSFHVLVGTGGLSEGNNLQYDGMSIRCIKDAE